MVNPHASAARETEIAVRGGAATAVRAMTMAAADIHAHNTFDNPEAVRPREDHVPAARGATLTYRFLRGVGHASHDRTGVVPSPTSQVPVARPGTRDVGRIRYGRIGFTWAINA